MKKFYSTFSFFLVVLSVVLINKVEAQTVTQNVILLPNSYTVAPSQAISISNEIKVTSSSDLISPTFTVTIPDGLTLNSCVFTNSKNGSNFTGLISENNGESIIVFSSLPDFTKKGGNKYMMTLNLKVDLFDYAGNLFTNSQSLPVVIEIKGSSAQPDFLNVETIPFLLNSNDFSNLIFKTNSNSGPDNSVSNSWTVSAIDVDNDNDDDLFFTDATMSQPNRLFLNNGNGTFEKVTSGAIVTDAAKSMASSWADYDGDGDLDVVIANSSMKPCFFYENNGNGTFTKNTKAAFTKNIGYYHHVSWVDVDNDGKLELYLANYLPSKLNELWKQDESGNWSLWTDNLLSQVVGSSVGATWCDYDNDGFQDLILLNNAAGKNRMYHNLGNGQFEEVFNTITNHGGYSVSSTWGDIDNDGDFDLFISNASNKNNELYINDGGGSFTLVTTGRVVNDGGHSHGAVFFDVDKDGYLDLFVTNDQGNKFFYLNNGSGNFNRIEEEYVNVNFGNAFGVSVSDLDNDGDVDLAVSTHSNQPDYTFKANDNNNNWLKVNLEGTISNKSAVGAYIKLRTKHKSFYRYVASQNGIGGQNSYRVHFGVGNEDEIDYLEIRWPSGYIQTVKDIKLNRNLHIKEDQGAKLKLIAYVDQNKNCKYDIGEQLLKDVKFQLNSGQINSVTNLNGEVNLSLAINRYNVSFDNVNYKSTCSYTKRITVDKLTQEFIEYYALEPVCKNADLVVKAYTVVMRKGFNAEYTIEVENTNLGVATGTILTATIPSSVNIDSANVAWETNLINSDGSSTITWQLGDLSYGALTNIKLYFRVSLDVSLGQQIESSFNVTSTSFECSSTNNEFVDLQTVLGSFDPNDMLVFPIGETDNHYVKNDQKITYRIRFQNVGTYEAEFVNVIDELPEGIDANSISNIVSSHRYQLTTEGNKLYFYFPEIHLPDSSSNMEGSNGFIQFSVDQNSEIENGAVLYNKASIQFDYNEYITTNTVFHTIIVDEAADTKGSLVLFPNPSSEYAYARVSIDNEVDPVLSKIIVYSQDGREVVYEETNANVFKIEVSVLPEGVYFVKAIDRNGREFSGKLQVARY